MHHQRLCILSPSNRGSSLAFAIGIMPGAWDKIPQGVKFDIEILCDGRQSEYLFPCAPT